jgi:hypothetical protein
MDDLIEAYLSVYEDSDIKSRAEAAVDHQRHGDHGMAEAVDDEGRAYRNPSDRKPSTSSSGSRPVVTTPHKDAEQELKRTDPKKAAAKRKRLAANILRQSNEEVDLYDVVLDYLLDEGYADTEENAITIMANMSEEWIDDILDEAKVDQDLTPLQKIRKRNKEYALPGEPAGQQTSNRRAERSSTRGVKQKKGAKSAFGTMRNIGGPYN